MAGIRCGARSTADSWFRGGGCFKGISCLCFIIRVMDLCVVLYFAGGVVLAWDGGSIADGEEEEVTSG